MDFLALCQKAARETGVVSGTQPTSVSGQTGTLLQIIGYVADAWSWLQDEERGWLWMRKSFTLALTASNQTYTSASASLTDWATWEVDDLRRGYQPLWMYETAEGVADETPLKFIEYRAFEKLYLHGTQTDDRPVHYTVSDAGALLFGPSPDTAYSVLGKYRQAPVTLAANTDTPGCPAQFHIAIAWEAARRYAEFDEAPTQVNYCTAKRDDVMMKLRRDQLERRIIRAGKIA